MDQSLTEQRRNDGQFLWMVCSAFVGLALGAALMWWGVFVYHDRAQGDTLSHLNQQLVQTRLKLNALHAEQGVLEGKLAVEHSTRQGLERTLQAVQQELGAARDQIAFYHELLPPGPDGSISIRGFTVQQQEDLLQFRVLLMRHGAGDQPFAGMLQFRASGKLDGESHTAILEPARARVPADLTVQPDARVDVEDSESNSPAPSSPTLALRFDQFHRSAGLLQVPEGFELESVTLNILEGDTLRVSRTVDIPVPGAGH